MAILCRADEGYPCGACISCRKVAGEIHPDLHIFEGEKKPGGFHVDAVRKARSQAFVLPNESERKVILLEDCETMTEQAQNALLTILEEPTESTTFLLTARSRDRLLPTILSRVIVITLETLSIAQCEEALEKLAPNFTPDERKAAAKNAFGSVGVAIEMLSQEEGNNRQSDGLTLLEFIAKGDEFAALVLLKNYEKDRASLGEMLGILRDNLARLTVEGEYRAGNAVVASDKLYLLCGVVEDAVQGVKSNAGGLILSSELCAKMMQVMDS